VAWKLLEKECTFGNQGSNSHSEETKKVRFLEFLVFAMVAVTGLMTTDNLYFNISMYF
jgi:hypothetical protein